MAINLSIHFIPWSFRNRLGRWQSPSVLCDRRNQRFVDQRALSTPANPGDSDQASQRNANIDRLKIVGRSAFKQQLFVHVGWPSNLRDFDSSSSAQEVRCRTLGLHDLAGRTHSHNLTTFTSCPRPHVDQAISCPHHRLVMLDHQQGIPLPLQVANSLNQSIVIALVESDTWLIENIANTDQTRTDAGANLTR